MCGYDFDRTGAKPCPIQLPIGAENSFAGMVDPYNYEGMDMAGEDLGATWTQQEVRPELLETAKK